jgi:sRNA-binding protein
MYLQGMVAGAARIDLDGNPAGEVTARDAEYAAAKLAGILASREIKRAAAVEARAQVAKPVVVTAAAPPPAKPLKARPVLRLPAFRQKYG